MACSAMPQNSGVALAVSVSVVYGFVVHASFYAVNWRKTYGEMLSKESEEIMDNLLWETVE